MARFPRRARLLKPGEFQNVFKRGKRINERWLTAVSVSTELGHPRLGLASDRNRIKRKIRDHFRRQQDQLLTVDIVLLARPGCGKARAAELDQNLERLWTRIAASSPPSSPAPSSV
jgi:ribonuclease P protein component